MKTRELIKLIATLKMKPEAFESDTNNAYIEGFNDAIKLVQEKFRQEDMAERNKLPLD